jgi:hypothetical protein
VFSVLLILFNYNDMFVRRNNDGYIKHETKEFGIAFVGNCYIRETESHFRVHSLKHSGN